MLLPNEIQLIFGVKTEEELYKKKSDTSAKQIKSLSVVETPRLVSLTEDECKKLCEKVHFEFRPGYEQRVIERVVTTETPDRDGDIVRAKGIDNSEYRNEPVVLFAHDRGNLPVGRSLKEWIDNDVVGWKSWDLYFDNDIDTTGRSDVVFRMVKSGAMRGCSIGFLPLDSKYDHSEDERKKLGLGRYGVEYRKIRKLEHSACSVPANQEALALSLKSMDKKILQGMLTKNDLDIMEKHNMIDNKMIDVFCSVLEIKRSVDDKREIETGCIEKESINMVVNLSIDNAVEKLSKIEIEINKLNENINNIQKSLTEKVETLIATAEKTVSAIERKDTESGLYDKKSISDILKL